MIVTSRVFDKLLSWSNHANEMDPAPAMGPINVNKMTVSPEDRTPLAVRLAQAKFCVAPNYAQQHFRLFCP
jgi:hypothetical protein